MPYTRPLWLRILIRTINFTVLIFTLYFVVFRLFPYFDRSHSLILSLLLTYLLAAYLLFPLSVRLSGALTKRQRVARYTSTSDGLAMDPINIVIVGSFAKLKR